MSRVNKNHCASSTTVDDSPGKYHNFTHFLLRSTFCGHVITELLGTVGGCDFWKVRTRFKVALKLLNLELWCFCVSVPSVEAHVI